jgi:hypothetical protein|tara:strand:- start:577 stop:1152 length:576 start_codon:yes stop_codon:yes gene_type:complete
MISSETFHVVTTELVVGAFSVAGLSFTLCLLLHLGVLKQPSWSPVVDHVAHFTLAFGLAATPFAILSGLSSAPGEGLNSPILVNKMFLSMTGFGFALGCLIARWRLGDKVWSTTKSVVLHSASGLAAVGSMLLTASAGGTFARGESLLDMFHLPYEHVLLFPVMVSTIALLLGLTMLVLSWKRMNASSTVH